MDTKQKRPVQLPTPKPKAKIQKSFVNTSYPGRKIVDHTLLFCITEGKITFKLIRNFLASEIILKK